MSTPNLAISIVVGMPLIGSVSHFLVSKLFPAFHLRKGHSRFLAISIVIVVALYTSMAALFIRETVTSAGIAWMPDTGAIAATVSRAGLITIAVIAWSAIPPLIATPPHPALDTLTLTMLAAANAAMLSNHFLARYVALEIVVIVVALAPLVELGIAGGASAAMFVYLLLRLGDAGLLTALSILNAGHTIDIGPALQTAHTLPATTRVWIVTGFLLAAWVKLGAWPFHLWLRSSRALSPIARTWIYAIAVPGLGAYLLHRTAPLLVSSETLCLVALWVGGVTMPIALITAGQKQHPSAIGLVAAQGGLALLLTAVGMGALVWQNALLSILPRLMLFHAADAPRPSRATRWMTLLGWLSATGLSAFMIWAAWQNLTRSGLPVAYHLPLLPALSASALMLLKGTRGRVIKRRPDDGNRYEATRVINNTGESPTRQQWAKQLIMAPARRLQQLHTGQLRRNLLWVVISLASVLLGLIFLVPT